jgi:hypothetical protein
LGTGCGHLWVPPAREPWSPESPRAARDPLAPSERGRWCTLQRVASASLGGSPCAPLPTRPLAAPYAAREGRAEGHGPAHCHRRGGKSMVAQRRIRISHSRVNNAAAIARFFSYSWAARPRSVIDVRQDAVLTLLSPSHLPSAISVANFRANLGAGCSIDVCD